MIERPIKFNEAMVRALLAGAKTQMRRAVKLPHGPLDEWEACVAGGPNGGLTRAGLPIPKQGGIWNVHTGVSLLCPYGEPGDRLWVREDFDPIYPQDPTYNGGRPIEYDYRASYRHGDRSGDYLGIPKRWKKAGLMRRQDSRITLEIVDVRVGRLGLISEADAIAEGVERTVTGDGWRRYADPASEAAGLHPCATARGSFRSLWETTTRRIWDGRLWVWVIEFKLLPKAQSPLLAFNEKVEEVEEVEEVEDEPVCPRCHGDGRDPWVDYLMPCPYCQGEFHAEVAP